MDEACKEHDIAYAKTTNTKERNQADKILAKKAWKRVKSSNAKLSERIAAASVAGIMAMKSKIGAGLMRKKKRESGSIDRRRRHRHHELSKKKGKAGKIKKKKNKTISPKQQKIEVKHLFDNAVKHAKYMISVKKPKPLKNAVILAREAAQAIVNKNKTLSKTAIKNNLPRVIPIPKQEGGAIPIFGALSALGAIMGGAAGIANAITSAKDARKIYDESKRHNETMEAIAVGKKPKNGNGLFLGPHPRKDGLGLFLRDDNNVTTPKN